MGGLYVPFKDFIGGAILTEADLDGLQAYLLANHIPTMIDDYSGSVAQMQTMVDPGEVGSESLPNALSGELARLRKIISELSGNAQWYESPVASIAALLAADGVLTAAVAALTAAQAANAQTLVASDAVERTCLNVATDLCTFAGLNIGVTDAVMITGRFRKTAGAAVAALLGLKINGVQILNNQACTSSVSQAEDGIFRYGPLRPGRVGYTRGIQRIELHGRVSSSGAESLVAQTVSWAADIPSVPFTSIAVTGNSNSASVTLAVQDVSVYKVRCS